LANDAPKSYDKYASVFAGLQRSIGIQFDLMNTTDQQWQITVDYGHGPVSVMSWQLGDKETVRLVDSDGNYKRVVRSKWRVEKAFLPSRYNNLPPPDLDEIFERVGLTRRQQQQDPNAPAILLIGDRQSQVPELPNFRRDFDDGSGIDDASSEVVGRRRTRESTSNTPRGAAYAEPIDRESNTPTPRPKSSRQPSRGAAY